MPTTDQRKHRVLLIEDNPGDARYIEELFAEARGFARRAFDGGTALRDDAAGSVDTAGGADGASSADGAGGVDSPEGADAPDGEGSAAALEDPDRAGGQPTLVHVSRLDAGLERLEDEWFDTVLLDLNLPDSTGLETLTTLRRHDELIPVVVLTGERDEEIGIDALRQGAEEYLIKDEINADLLVRSIYHSIERKAHEREQRRYETLIEESTDANAIVGPDGTIQYNTPSVEHVLGYGTEELIGESAFEYIHPDDRDATWEEFSKVVEQPDYRGEVEFRFRHADGSWVVLHARGRNLLDDPIIDGVVVYTHDVTERKEYERQLERQRERLAAMNELNAVVHRVTETVIERSTREEIEASACRRLVESESYEIAWIGEVNTATETISLRAAAGGDLEGETIPPMQPDADDRDDESVPGGPANRALRTGEIQTVQALQDETVDDSIRAFAEEYGVRSCAAIPIKHEGTIYGVLNVYSGRSDAFRHEERTVLGHLGEIIGHAIAATERKRALMSDAVVELEIGIPGVFEPHDPGIDEEIVVERAVPVSEDDGTFLIYGRTAESAIEGLEELCDRIPYWEELSIITELPDGSVRFELRLSQPPALSAVASRGGAVEEAVIEGGDYRMTVHLSQGVDVRQVIESIREDFPQADVLARRQVTDAGDPSERLTDAWTDQLTDRQRTAVEVAHYSGFFEWPRESSGEEVAESMGVSAPTFHQHVRAAEYKLFDALLEEPETKRTDAG